MTRAAGDESPLVMLAAPSYNGRELELLSEALAGSISAPDELRRRFERGFRTVVGRRSAVATSSVGAAMQVAATTVGWGSGDEIIVSPFAAASAARLVRGLGVAVRYADVDPSTLRLDPCTVDAVRTRRTRGVLATAVPCWPCQMDEINALARWHGLSVVHDRTWSLRGSDEEQAPSISWPEVYGLEPGMEIAASGAGMVCSDDEHIAAAARTIVDDLPQSPHRLAHDRLGIDVAMDELAAATGIAQLEKLARATAMRAQVAYQYLSDLDGLSGVQLPAVDVERSSWPVFHLLMPDHAAVVAVVSGLREIGVEARQWLTATGAAAPVARSVAARSIALPCHPHVSPQLQARIVRVVRRAVV